MRRRLFLMRHAAVAYFGADGRPVDPDDVGLTAEGEEQARQAAALLSGIDLDLVIASGLRRTMETARIVAPGREPEAWPELREIRGGRLGDVPEDEIERVVTRAFVGAVPLDATFLAGESFGSLVDRVVGAVTRLEADNTWDTALAVLHGGVNRADGRALLPRQLRAGALLHQRPRPRRRWLGRPRRQRRARRSPPSAHEVDDDGRALGGIRRVPKRLAGCG
ncbi:MAG TPA: histidine phosphatase family protein [Gaiellaceae bacterium]|nr:histidine phosphatase family protein [Gaiellaceae bacterium]